MAPDFVVVGHVVRDLVPNGWRLGGTATYAAAQAQRLGVGVGIVTRAGRDFDLEHVLPDVELAGAPSSETTTFQNVYERGIRRQRVLAVAEPMTIDDIPHQWLSASMVLLGPVCGEVPAEMSSALHSALLGVSAQGWLRTVDKEHRVRKRAWQGAPFWAGADILFVSDEDITANSPQLERWCADVPIVAFTHNRRGSQIHTGGAWRAIPAYPANEVDPTGAGDIFATAFMIEYRATTDVPRAARFASAAAACAVEASGIESIAGRDEIERRMAAHPEIDLR